MSAIIRNSCWVLYDGQKLFSNYQGLAFSKKIHTQCHKSLNKTSSLSAFVLEKMSLSSKATPVEKGYKYLMDSCNAKRCFQPSVSQYPDFRKIYSTPFPEIFDTSLILDLLHRKQLDPVIVRTGLRYILENQAENKLFCFFEDHSLLPQDVDDTSLAMIVLMKYQKANADDVGKVADAIIRNVDENGIIQTYFPPRNGRDGRLDLSVCANALRFIHQIGRGNECKPTENYLYKFLEKMKPLDNSGSLYYGNHAFIYFMWEAIKSSESLKARFGSLFADRVKSLINSSSSSIDLASRIAVLAEMNIPNFMEIDRLFHLHQEDGSWPMEVAYTGSRKNLFWGSKMVTTAFALHALDRENVAQLSQKMQSLPVLSKGFQVVDGYLQYTKSFSPLTLKFKIIVVTHTETYSSRSSKFYDADKDSLCNSLTEKGKQDVSYLTEILKKNISDNPIIIFHGENKRTYETAEIIKSHFKGSSSKSDSWLNELNCAPEWLGKHHQEVLENDFIAQAMFLKSNCLANPSNGENFLEFLNTVYTGLNNLQNKEFEKNTLIVLCTSRVNLVAIKILLQKEVILDSDHNIDWSTMAKNTKAGTTFMP